MAFLGLGKQTDNGPELSWEEIRKAFDVLIVVGSQSVQELSILLRDKQKLW